ncbi:MAG: NAD-dependent protein deacylase [Erysipelotrichaceae bacterium]
MNKELFEILKHSNNIVFFGGAGVSTESGIPDFRSNDGIYQAHKKYPYPAEVMVSSDFFYEHPDSFYEFYFDKMVYPQAVPNGAHLALAKLEKMGKLKAVITQNIDGLHQMAGNQEVLELHGSIHRNYCKSCHAFYDLNDMLKQKGKVPKCLKCGATIKPDVVLFGEALNDETIKKSIDYLQHADTLIVGGTSLVVYPAAGLLQYFHGNKLVLINRDCTDMDDSANLVIHEKIGEVLKEVVDAL